MLCHKQAHYAECRYAECRYAEYRYAECRGAALRPEITVWHHIGRYSLAQRIPETNTLAY